MVYTVNSDGEPGATIYDDDERDFHEHFDDINEKD